MKAIDRIGQRVGRLLVLVFVKACLDQHGRRVRLWKCRCDCGHEIVTVVQSSIRSCGCLKVEANRKNAIKHGHKLNRRRTPTLHSYTAMRERCENPHAEHYAYYGGRGIVVCEHWRGKHGFENFLPTWESARRKKL